MKKIALLVIVLLLPWGIGLIYNHMKYRFYLHCESHTSITYLLKNGETQYSRGTYLLSTALSGQGSGVYSGQIVDAPGAGGQTVTPVHVFFSYNYKEVGDGMIEGSVTSLSKEVGNMATDAQIARFLAPAFTPGEYHLTRMFMLEGIRQAWGTTAYPTGVCANPA